MKRHIIIVVTVLKGHLRKAWIITTCFFPKTCFGNHLMYTTAALRKEKVCNVAQNNCFITFQIFYNNTDNVSIRITTYCNLQDNVTSYCVVQKTTLFETRHRKFKLQRNQVFVVIGSKFVFPCIHHTQHFWLWFHIYVRFVSKSLLTIQTYNFHEWHNIRLECESLVHVFFPQLFPKSCSYSNVMKSDNVHFIDVSEQFQFLTDPQVYHDETRDVFISLQAFCHSSERGLKTCRRRYKTNSQQKNNSFFKIYF